MKVTGIIAEYNPFHTGHQYHMTKARAVTNADYIIVVMSGNYVQRGLPAIMDKYLRTELALRGGADLVLELPLPWADGSAEYFAWGGVSLLDQLGIVDFLCFGSESGNVQSLIRAASLLSPEQPLYSQILQKHLTDGLSYPAAQAAAYEECMEENSPLSTPNDRLGVEYCKALQRRSSSIVPVTVLRAGASYHEETLCSNSHSSATAIRKALLEDTSPETVTDQLPDWESQLLRQHWHRCFPVSPEDFSLLLQARLLSETPQSLKSYWDVSPALADKIIKHLPEYTTFSEFVQVLKSKELTHSRICRSLLHILLQQTYEDSPCSSPRENVPYARILGFRQDALPLLSAIKETSAIPLISKLADAHKVLSPHALSTLEAAVRADHLYDAVVRHKFGGPMPNEYRRQIVKL